MPSNLRILVAEDHDINRFIIDRMFKEWGIQTEFAVTGVEAVKAATNSMFDVILMDVEMPDMNGYKATEIIREQLPEPNRSIPIIAMTGHAMLGEKEKCLSIGMNDYISKPFKQEELKRKIIELSTGITGNNSTGQSNNGNVIAATTEQPAHENEPATQLTELSFLREISENNEQFFREFIQMFLANTPKSLEDIEAGIQENDYEKIRMASHKVKPSFNYVGLKEQCAQAAKIEELSKKKQDLQEITQLLNKIKTACKAAYVELESEIKTTTH